VKNEMKQWAKGSCMLCIVIGVLVMGIGMRVVPITENSITVCMHDSSHALALPSILKREYSLQDKTTVMRIITHYFAKDTFTKKDEEMLRAILCEKRSGFNAADKTTFAQIASLINKGIFFHNIHMPYPITLLFFIATVYVNMHEASEGQYIWKRIRSFMYGLCLGYECISQNEPFMQWVEPYYNNAVATNIVRIAIREEDLQYETQPDGKTIAVHYSDVDRDRIYKEAKERVTHYAHVPIEHAFAIWERGDGVFAVLLPNHFPYAIKNMLYVPNIFEHISQADLDTNDIVNVCTFLDDTQDASMRVGFNSAYIGEDGKVYGGGGASLNHLHWHVCRLPMGMPIEACETDPYEIDEGDGIMVRSVHNPGLEHLDIIVVKSAQKQLLSEKLMSYIHEINEKKKAYNLLLFKKMGEYYCYLAIRERSSDTGFYEVYGTEIRMRPCIPARALSLGSDSDRGDRITHSESYGGRLSSLSTRPRGLDLSSLRDRGSVNGPHTDRFPRRPPRSPHSPVMNKRSHSEGRTSRVWPVAKTLFGLNHSVPEQSVLGEITLIQCIGFSG
jgi:hypothetical protein